MGREGTPGWEVPGRVRAEGSVLVGLGAGGALRLGSDSPQGRKASACPHASARCPACGLAVQCPGQESGQGPQADQVRILSSFSVAQPAPDIHSYRLL